VEEPTEGEPVEGTTGEGEDDTGSTIEEAQ
jgi:hypothetical protein